MVDFQSESHVTTGKIKTLIQTPYIYYQVGDIIIPIAAQSGVGYPKTVILYKN